MKVSKLVTGGLMLVGGFVVVMWLWNMWGPGAAGE
jgi:hypothetical protein